MKTAVKFLDENGEEYCTMIYDYIDDNTLALGSQFMFFGNTTHTVVKRELEFKPTNMSYKNILKVTIVETKLKDYYGYNFF